jgi:YaiO family outer membrane protein
MAAPLAAQQPLETRSERVEAAEAARSASNFAEARRLLRSLLAEAPDDADLLRRLAMTEAGDGNLDEALALVERASQRAPADLDVALARAYILYWNGQYDAAEQAVAGIAARAPDYPDLAPLEANLQRQRDAGGIRLRVLSASASVSDIAFDNRGSQTWTSQNVAVASDVSQRSSITLALAQEDRNTKDTRLSARIDRRIGTGFVYIAASTVPDADFLERWSLAAGGEDRISERLTAILDTRIAEYETGTILALQPGLRFDLDDDFSLTARAINIFGGGDSYRLGGSARLDYRADSGLALFAIAASYPDVEADGVRQLRSGALGMAVPLSDRFTLSGATSYEDRENSYRRLSGTLALSYRFGTP